MPEFTPEQIAALEANLDGSRVSTRQQSGRNLSYIEGWWAIAEANRIFGFGAWQSEVKELYPVVTAVQGQPNYTGGNGREGYLVAYRATVRITVGDQVHEDTGSGTGIDYSSVAAADESASKEAVTDARKRALMQWGNPFGLALYDKTQANVDKAQTSRNGASAPRRAAPRKPQVSEARKSAQQALIDKFGTGNAAGEAKVEFIKEATGRKVIDKPDELTDEEWARVEDLARGPSPLVTGAIAQGAIEAGAVAAAAKDAPEDVQELNW